MPNGVIYDGTSEVTESSGSAKQLVELVGLLGRIRRDPELSITTSASSSLDFQRFLGSLTTSKILLGPTRACGPLPADRRGRIDKNDLVAKSVPTGLQHHRGVQHDRRDASVCSANWAICSLQLLADPGMGQLFQILQLRRPLRRVREHDLGQAPADAICAISAKDLIAPTLAGPPAPLSRSASSTS